MLSRVTAADVAADDRMTRIHFYARKQASSIARGNQSLPESRELARGLVRFARRKKNRLGGTAAQEHERGLHGAGKARPRRERVHVELECVRCRVRAARALL